MDVDAFIEYHIGDCSCEHGHECQSCTMKKELRKELDLYGSQVREADAKIAENFKGIGCVCSIDGINIADAIRSAGKGDK